MTHVAAPSYQQTLAPPAQPQPMHALPPQQVPQPATAAPVAAQVAPATRGGISGRLGFSLVGGQLAVPQKQPPAPQPQAVGSQQPSGMALPVGVGIRLGGVGGVAPSTAQGAVRQGTAHYAMWGGPTTGGAMSEQAVAERRQRNREHAKRSRVRKKFMLESLQEQVRALQKDNVELRMLIQQKLPQHAQKIISECCGKSPLFSDPNDPRGINGSTEQTNGTAAPADAATQASSRKETSLVRSDFTLIESLTSGQQNFVLSDPRLPDNPIVYASPGFFELTGYSQDQVLGRNCRFLQGPGTDPRAVDIIRTAIANGSDATTCLLNYKSDGTPFWNQFFVAALRDSDNCIVNYVGTPNGHAGLTLPFFHCFWFGVVRVLRTAVRLLRLPFYIFTRSPILSPFLDSFPHCRTSGRSTMRSRTRSGLVCIGRQGQLGIAPATQRRESGGSSRCWYDSRHGY